MTTKDYYELKTADVLKKVEADMRNYMSSRPNLSYEVETLRKNSLLFILAHCKTDDGKAFGCAYLKGCYGLDDNSFIYRSQNVLDNKQYTIEDAAVHTKNYLNHILNKLA